MATSTVHLGRYDVEIPRPDKELFPADGITKADLADHYRTVAGRMLPHLADRPIAMERYPDGIDGERIFAKSVPDYFPDWITTATVSKEDGELRQVVCDKAATLVYLAGQACITPHTFLSRVDRLDRPDQMILDLDPPDEAGFRDARAAALALRGILVDELELAAYVKTTGGKGLHVHVPLDRRAGFDSVREVARDIARLLVARDPDRYTIEQRKAKRGSRLFIDVMRNAYAQTAVPPYAVRARPGAPVATPLDWDEVEDRGLRPDRFTIRTIGDRLAAADPWSHMRQHARGLTKARDRLAAET